MENNSNTLKIAGGTVGGTVGGTIWGVLNIE